MKDLGFSSDSAAYITGTLKVKVAQSCLTLCNPMDCPWNFLGQDTGVGSLSFRQGIFPTQGSNPGLPRCGQILYQLSHKGSPRILEWVAYPFCSKSSSFILTSFRVPGGYFVESLGCAYGWPGIVYQGWGFLGADGIFLLCHH